MNSLEALENIKAKAFDVLKEHFDIFPFKYDGFNVEIDTKDTWRDDYEQMAVASLTQEEYEILKKAGVE